MTCRAYGYLGCEKKDDNYKQIRLFLLVSKIKTFSTLSSTGVNIKVVAINLSSYDKGPSFNIGISC